ncbi:MAG: hypothetical protein WCG45_02235, partial [bacterium]
MENLPTQDNKTIDIISYFKNNLLIKNIILYILIILFFVLSISFFLSAPNSFPKGIIVSIKQGENLTNLSFDLKEKKVIRSRVAFETFVIIYGGEKHIAIGDYLFENKLP